jgi:hypothetical protein
LFVFSTEGPITGPICRCDFDLRLPLVKFSCANDADDFPLQCGDPQVSRHFGTGTPPRSCRPGSWGHEMKPQDVS